MTGSNHALTGAVIAGLVKEPAAALPLAFASHFIMDAIPHFGVSAEKKEIFVRNKDRAFRVIVGVDSVLLPVSFILVPHYLRPLVPVWLTLACMALAFLPDLFWVWRFFYERRSRLERAKSWFSRFHLWVQWKETPLGVLAEAVWFGLMIWALILIRHR